MRTSAIVHLTCSACRRKFCNISGVYRAPRGRAISLFPRAIVAGLETAAAVPFRMTSDTPKEPSQGPLYVPSLDHLVPRKDVGPTPEQAAKEAARRKGRRRKEWWKDCPPRPD